MEKTMAVSSLFSMFGNNTPQYSGLANMMNQFKQFKQNFQGDPRQRVQELLNSGQMTQQQFNQLSQAATQFQQMMNGRF